MIFQGGILNPEDYKLGVQDPDFKRMYKRMQGNPLPFRIKNISWWERELPNKSEMQEGLENLKKYNNKVDFIITHSPCTSDLFLLGGAVFYDTDILTNYLEEVRTIVDYQKWYFGHMHINKQPNLQDLCLYEQILMAPDKNYVYQFPEEER